MNTMKKWVVAGLIGLFSGGVSNATIIFDFGMENDQASVTTADNTLDPITGGAGALSTLTDLALNVGAPLVTAYNPVMSIIAGNAAAGGDLTFSYDRNNAVGSRRVLNSFTATYDLATLGVTASDYLGVAINFSTVAPVGYGNDNFLLTLYDAGGNAVGTEYVFSSSAGNPMHMAPKLDGDYLITWTDLAVDPASVGKVELFYQWSWQALSTTVNWDDTVNVFGLYKNDEQGVPEPETVWMILAVLGSLGVTFRRQLMGMFVKA